MRTATIISVPSATDGSIVPTVIEKNSRKREHLIDRRHDVEDAMADAF